MPFDIVSAMTEKLRGTIYGTLAFISWGFLLLFWNAISSLPPLSIVMYRFVWAAVYASVFLLMRRRFRNLLRIFARPRLLLMVLLRGFLLLANWTTFAVAVLLHRTLDAGLGYTISPLISMMLGVALFRERLRRAEIAAVLLAVGSVLYLAIIYGAVPWIGILVAVTFACYGALRKKTDAGISPFEMLSAEVLLYSLPAMLVLVYGGINGQEIMLTASPLLQLGILATGAATLLPLALFAAAAKRVSLITIGFLNYLTPIIMFMVSLLAFREDLEMRRLPGFILAWLAVLVYLSAQLSARRKKTQ